MTDNYQPWTEYPNIWKTEAMYLSWIRGGIRRYLWSKNPVKLEFVKSARKMITNPNVKLRKGRPEVWGGICEICGREHPLKNMEVDHKSGEHSLKKVSDIQKFVEGIVFIRKEDLAFLCKPCHKIKTNAERKGLSHEDSAIDKEAIALMKLTPAEQKNWLKDRGVDKPGVNAKIRREQVTNILKEGR
jgi:5-methylcytosine-specific restriction endonuclease McrA